MDIFLFKSNEGIAPSFSSMFVIHMSSSNRDISRTFILTGHLLGFLVPAENVFTPDTDLSLILKLCSAIDPETIRDMNMKFSKYVELNYLLIYYVVRDF